MTRDDHTTTEAAAADHERDHTLPDDYDPVDEADLTREEAARIARANTQRAAALRWWAS